MDTLEVPRLTKRLAAAMADVDARHREIIGNDIVMFIGCTGAGKSTVHLHIQGVKIIKVKTKLEAQGGVAGFEIGNNWDSKTSGFHVAKVPDADGLFLVDVAGTGDVRGIEADICGALYRSKLLRLARTVRIVLVIHADRIGSGNGKGGPALRDMDYVAGLFADVSQHIESVGIIVTSKPRDLDPDNIAGVLRDLSQATEGLARCAVAVGDGAQRADTDSGSEITHQGLLLLRHFNNHVQKAIEVLDEVPEGPSGTMALLQKLLESRCAVWPANVTKEEQVPLVREFILGLKPIECPTVAIKPKLPYDCRLRIKASVGPAKDEVLRKILDLKWKWASEENAKEVTDLMVLGQVLEQSQLLPWGSTVRDDIADQLLAQNMSALDEAVSAIVWGKLAKLGDALAALLSMDRFRKMLDERMPGLRLDGWISFKAALGKLTGKAAEALAKHLNAGSSDIKWSQVKWDASLSATVSGIFRAVAMLDAPGASLLSEWAKELVEEVKRLKQKASEVSAVGVVLKSLSTLREYCEFLPDIIKVLSPHGAESLDAGGLQTTFEDAKVAVKEKLGEMSKNVVEERRASGKATASWEPLLQLCRSTELQELLGDKDLEENLMMIPLSDALAPEQGEIDSLASLISVPKSAPELWCARLDDLHNRVAGMGELGPRMIKTKNLNFEELVKGVKSASESAKEQALEAVESVRQSPAFSSRKSMAAPSLLSGVSTRDVDDDSPLEVEGDEAATDAVDMLVKLSPGDALLRIVGPPCAAPAAMALQTIGWKLKRAVQSVLRRAKRIQGRLSWSMLATIDSTGLAAMLGLKALSDSTENYLKCLDKDLPATKGLHESLSRTHEEAHTFIQDFVNRELEEWANAKTSGCGWPDVFDRHFQMAKSLRPLDPEAVGTAERALEKEVDAWVQDRRKETDDLFKDETKWKELVEQMVSEGMAFEDSTLFARKLQHPQFRPLAETLAATWIKAADTADPASKSVVWQKLKTLSLAIERLPSYARKDTRTSSLYEKLVKALEPLEKTLTDHDSRFQQHVTGGRFVEASKLLPLMKDTCRHSGMLKDDLVRALRAACEGLDDSGTLDDAVRKAQTAKKLQAEAEKLPHELREQVKEHLSTLKEAITAKIGAAQTQLFRALEGGGDPTRALNILAALTAKPAEELAATVLTEFIKTEKEALEKMTLEQLVEWILKHSEVKKELPKEFKSVSAFTELTSHFLKYFTAAGENEAKSCDDFQKNCQWDQAKQAHEKLRDAIETVENLDGFKKPDFRKLNGKLASASVAVALDGVKRGEFPIWAVVTGTITDSEALCNAIHEKVLANINVQSVDEQTAHQRLCVLEAFLKAVGDHPPDQLRSLWREVNATVGSVQPEINKRAEKLAEEGRQAASGDDLVALARSLQQLKHFEGRAPADHKKQLDEAVQQFWARVWNSLTLVANNIKELNVQGVGLNLRPVGGWMASFSQHLSTEQKQLLLKSLPGDHSDFESYIRQALAAPVKDLMDPEKVQSLAEARNFSEISLRRRISQKLDAVVKMGTVSLDAICQNMRERKDRARSVLMQGNLEDFNIEYKVLKAVEAGLPEVSVKDYLSELEKDVQDRILDQNLTKIREAQRITDALRPIVEVRSVANKAPDLYAHVMQRLGAAVEDLVKSGRFSVFNLNTLGGKLAQMGQTGQAVITELPEVFGTVRDRQNAALFAQFRRPGETHDLGEVVDRLTRRSGLGHAENKQLREALALHERAMQELETKYFCHEKSLEEIYDEAKQDLLDAVAQCRSEDGLSAQRVLTHLAACYMVRQSAKEFLEAPPKEQHERLVAPHRAQMLTLYRLLHAHQTSNSLWQWLVSLARSPTSKPENHLAQVLTGEGKCLTLGLLAAFLALKGIPSDVVCYRKLLTEQDRAAMARFYEYVGVQDKIRYVTFDDLCNERLESFKKAAKALMESGEMPEVRERQDASGRALLVDEVDVFFGHKFYGETWECAFKLDSPEAKALPRYIFEEKTKGRSIPNITQVDVFKDLLDKYHPEMHQALTCAALSLVRNIDHCSTPEPILDPTTGKFGYKEKDEVDYELSYSNKTVFAYLDAEHDKKITKEQADKHLGLDLFCGRFSFAELPQKYCCILGVTGTLAELLEVPGIKSILETEYSFKHYTYTPSIFGDRDALLDFKYKEDVYVLENEADWASHIATLIRDLKLAGYSVLVFFKNEEHLQKFPGACNFETLTERTDKQRRSGYIAAAVTAGQVTLLTRAFGRGIDFRMPEGHKVVVVQTFLSSLVSEQTQIKGRTARQGKQGAYRVVLCASHLEGKMGFSKGDVSIVKNGDADAIKNKLVEKQKQKMAAKAAGMGERKKKAAELEKETQLWEKMLFDQSISVDLKLKKLAQWNGLDAFQQVHYTVLLDNSGSMEPSWQQLTEAYAGFKEELLKDPVTAAATQVTTILFNHLTQVISPHHAKASEVQDIGHHLVTGGTNFCNAFKECRQIIGRSSPDTKEMIIFLTDGEANVLPVQEINDLLVNHGGRIKSFMSIAFGHATATQTQALNQIGQLFSAKQIAVKSMRAADRTSLVETFKEAAMSRAVHGACG